MTTFGPFRRLMFGLGTREKVCRICGKRSRLIASSIGVCVDCLRNNSEEALKIAMEAHRTSKGMYGLPPEPPRRADGIACGMCANECVIGEKEYGYCGLVKVEDGRLVRIAGTEDKGLLEWYYDPLPTNCVAEPFCPGCRGVGYPKYAYSRDGPEYGHDNLAVFYGACSLDCLFCQNWHYRELTLKARPLVSAEELADVALRNRRVSCICYFGGDPSPQMPHALKVSEIALERADKEHRIMRICWETNGLMKRTFLEKAVELSLVSGGIVKVDFKAWHEAVHKALCGVSNRPIIENLRVIAKRFDERPEVPLLVVSTLLVPGYVDAEEVRCIASYLADLDPRIPLVLLAFYPQYLMTDLPCTSRRHALECVEVAKREGLERVTIGNIHLLGDYY